MLAPLRGIPLCWCPWECCLFLYRLLFWEGEGRRLCAWQIPGPFHPYHEIAILGFDLCLSPQAYNIHVNGVLHCRVRYSQLLGLHEQVGSLGAAVGLPVGLLRGALCPCRQGIGSHGVGDRNAWVLREGSALLQSRGAGLCAGCGWAHAACCWHRVGQDTAFCALALGTGFCSHCDCLDSCKLLDEEWVMSCLLPLSEPWKSARFGGWGSHHLPGGSHSTLLSSQLRKEYGANVVPAFPPKKIFTLTPAEVEQRREQLEKYMQAGKLGLPMCAVAPCFPGSAAQGMVALPGSLPVATWVWLWPLPTHSAEHAAACLGVCSCAVIIASIVP